MKVWSKKYCSCIQCGTNQIKHRAKGLCINCYEKFSTNKAIQHRKSKVYGESAKVLSKKYLMHQYIEKEMSLIDIARTANCSRQYVYKLIKQYGIQHRDKSEARKLAYEKDKLFSNNINELFFSNWSKGMAYVLGFICADGNISISDKGYKFLSISQKDPIILEKIKTLMSCDSKLIKRKNWPKGYLYIFSICNDQICSDLIKLGVSPAKSNIIDYPKIPPEFSNHFIRGVFDGDGSVYFVNSNKKRIYVSFVSGSAKFLRSLQDIINKELNNISCKFYVSKRSKQPEKVNYEIKLLAQKQIYNFFKFLYRNSTKNMYLERKRRIFDLWERALEDNFKSDNFARV